MTVTLAQIEQETARRCGPYKQVNVASGTTTTFVAATLQSTVDLGGLDNLFVLRRGLLANGSAVPGYAAADRVRLVKEYTPATGTVEVDNTYATAPAATELIEFHHLQPDEELRVAAQKGLWRCYFEDRAALTLASVASEQDLTALAAWLTEVTQVKRIEWTYTGDLSLPKQAWWDRLFVDSGSLYVQFTDIPTTAVLVTARRPHATLVNGITDTDGPSLDADTLAVDLEYAAAAAHVEAWKRFAYRLRPTAEAGLYPNQQAAAAEFTRLAKQHYIPSKRPRLGFSEPFGVRQVQRA